ncbi:MAG: TspO/MBR family protein [Steroidobacteraceae bacterium]
MTRASGPELRIRPGAPRGQWRAVAVIVLAVLATAVAGAMAARDARAFYALLARPVWAPPAELFAPVWTVLYVLMAVAALLLWRARASFSGVALPLFFIQLGANALWSWLFFRQHLGAVALIDVALLWMLLVATAWAFWQVQRTAALLLLPYLLWTGFAVALTAALWKLNPGLL